MWHCLEPLQPLPVDRCPLLGESIAAFTGLVPDGSYFRRPGVYILKKSSLILAAILLAPVLLVGLAAFAAGDWRDIGQTASGNKVSVSSVRKLKNNMRTAWVRVEYKDPVRLAQAGPFVELRARVRFNCATAAAVPTAEWLYARDRSGKLVVVKKPHSDNEFGKASEDSFGPMASQFVCAQ